MFEAKEIAKAVPRSTHLRAIRPLQFDATDLSDPHHFPSSGGAFDTMTPTCMYSAFWWVHFLWKKSDVVSFFPSFMSELSWSWSKVEAVQHDNCWEIIGEESLRVCLNNMARQERTTPGTSKQNRATDDGALRVDTGRFHRSITPHPHCPFLAEGEG